MCLCLRARGVEGACYVSVLLCTHTPCYFRGRVSYNGVSGWHGGNLSAMPRTLLAQPGKGGACSPRSAWGHDAVPCGASGLSFFPGNVPPNCCWPRQPSSSPLRGAWEVRQTGWLPYHCIGQRCFCVFPSVSRTQRGFICLELCWVASVATNYLARQCKTGFLLNGSGKAMNLVLTGASLGTCNPQQCHGTPGCLSGPQGARPLSDTAYRLNSAS